VARPAAAALLSGMVRLRLFSLSSLFGAVVVVVALASGHGRSGVEPAVSYAAPAPVEAIQVEVHREPVAAVARSGDTLETICRRLAGGDWSSWKNALVAHIDPRQLRPGTSFTGQREAGGSLAELEVTLDQRSGLRLVRDGTSVRCERVDRPLETEVMRLEGEIESSLFGAVEKAGGDPDLAVRIAEIYQWDIDFLRDLQRGDRFSVVVACDRVEGRFYRWGTVYAARFSNRGRNLDAVAYPDDSGRLGYYDAQGKPLQKQFLRSPLEFSRITSRFSMRRFHPVLKRTMPHYGVDYGAPVGTPVRATGAGVVSFAGSSGGAGRMVTIRHANGYETNYLHLSRFGSGIHSGTRVGQGQVIGFVGSSGLSTGPHLDFRVRQNGRWINPLAISSPPAEPLGAARIARFLCHAKAVVALLEGREPPRGARC
jgi:murein DD-endopeptidase MepM/ murein hydrolase activator NlpD